MNHPIAVGLFVLLMAELVALSGIAVSLDRRDDKGRRGSPEDAASPLRGPRSLPLKLVGGGVVLLLVAAACEHGRFQPLPSGRAASTPAPCLPHGTGLTLFAQNTHYSTGLVGCLASPSGTPFTIAFDNRDAGVFHNVSLYAGPRMYSTNSPTLFHGTVIKGPSAINYRVPALPPGVWTFHCDVHPDQMFGNFVVPTDITDAGFEPRSAVLSAGQQMAWEFDPSNRSDHELVDGSGLFGGRSGPLDSGPHPPGSSYVFTFFAAGTYELVDANTKATGTIEVPVQVRPSGATPGIWDVIWSLMPAPRGFIFDVQVERPRAGGFVSYLDGQQAGDVGFMPDAGPGVYSFRARLRNLQNEKVSGWSVPASVRLP